MTETTDSDFGTSAVEQSAASGRRERLLDALTELEPGLVQDGVIDVDSLTAILVDHESEARERFGLSWPGKSEAIRASVSPTTGTLLPQTDKSVGFGSASHVFVEGDNLQVLKILTRAYYGTVDVIYIDPPYNTGSDFIYEDDYRHPMNEYLRLTGQVDAGGQRLTTNPETSGRYHSKWLSMMYPRALSVARGLLNDLGVIMVSIDEHEVAHLRLLLDEILGPENFIAELVWEKTRKNDARLFSVGHDYVLVYARNKARLLESGARWREETPGAREILIKVEELRAIHGTDFPAAEKALQDWYRRLPASDPSKKLSRYRHIDATGVWRDRDISWPGPGGPRYAVIHPVTGEPCAIPPDGWRFATPEAMQEQIEQGLIEFREDHTQPPFRKAYLASTDGDDGDNGDEDDVPSAGMKVMPSVIHRQAQVASRYLRGVLGRNAFESPKDHEVLARLIRYVSAGRRDAIVLDFFGGSGSTADAVLRLNQEDGGSRQFVLVQLPEPVDRDDALWQDIAELCRERIRRVLQELETEQSQVGFRSFALSPSTLLTWDEVTQMQSSGADQLTMFVETRRPGSEDTEIAWEILVKNGMKLDQTMHEAVLSSGDTIRYSQEPPLAICLEPSSVPLLASELVALGITRCYCLDSAFRGSDEAKLNASLDFEHQGVELRTI